MSHADTINAYYAAWIADDLETVLSLCTDDVVAINVPIGPIHGHRVLVSGDSAVIEGVESYVKNGKQVSLPYMSTFLFRGDKICEWRDYFDLQTVLKQLGLPLDGSKPAKAASGA
jgi:limonene-1,2-epoxide hydrolase